MRQINKLILAIITSLISFTACDDFLEPESLSTFDLKYIYSNVDDARKGVNAMYIQFNNDAFRSRLSTNMTGNTDIEHGPALDGNGGRYDIWALHARENNNDLAYVWNYGYQAIRNANIAIDGIKGSDALNSEDKTISNEMHHLLGEALTMRSYWYSMLIYYFGDVPFLQNAPSANIELNLPKENRNIILSSLIKDLIDIEERMKWADELQFGIEQINREYTLGMIARLSLQRGGWYLKPDLTMERDDDYLEYYEIARKYSHKLITLKDRPLPSDFRQIFMNQCKFISPVNDEILFEVPFPIGAGDVGWNIGITVQPGNHPYGQGNNYMAMPPTYLYSFDREDKRLPVTCAFHYWDADFVQQLVGVSNMNISQGKWSRAFLENPPGPSSSKGTGINWPMMRYSDVLLMYAEAENELNGPTPSAIDAFKRVRKRAFDESLWSSKVDHYIASKSGNREDFFKAIVDERAWEFGGEMIRRFELIRWNLYYEKALETVEGLKKMADDAFNASGDLPDYIYIKRDSNGDLIIYNLFDKVQVAPDETWERRPWLISMHSDVQEDGYASWITTNWSNYINGSNIGVPDGVVRYLFPIPTIGIDNSKGLLKNDGYNFNY